MNRGAWRATVHGVAKSRTQLSDGACGHPCADAQAASPAAHLGWSRAAARGSLDSLPSPPVLLGWQAQAPARAHLPLQPLLPGPASLGMEKPRPRGQPVLWPHGGGTRWPKCCFPGFFFLCLLPKQPSLGDCPRRGHGAWGERGPGRPGTQILAPLPPLQPRGTTSHSRGCFHICEMRAGGWAQAGFHEPPSAFLTCGAE